MNGINLKYNLNLSERGSRSKETGKSLLISFLIRIDQLNSWEQIFLNWKSKRTFLAVKTDNYDIVFNTNSLHAINCSMASVKERDWVFV